MKYILYCCHKLFFIGVKKTASALILNRYENRKLKLIKLYVNFHKYSAPRNEIL